MNTYQEYVESKAPGKAGMILPIATDKKPLADEYSALAQDYNGMGRIQFPNGDVYEGEFRKGKMEGRGVLKSTNGDHYQG